MNALTKVRIQRFLAMVFGRKIVRKTERHCIILYHFRNRYWVGDVKLIKP